MTDSLSAFLERMGDTGVYLPGDSRGSRCVRGPLARFVEHDGAWTVPT